MSALLKASLLLWKTFCLNNYVHQRGIIFMIICLFPYSFVCLFAGLHKYYWLDRPEKKPSANGSWSNLDPIHF